MTFQLTLITRVSPSFDQYLTNPQTTHSYSPSKGRQILITALKNNEAIVIIWIIEEFFLFFMLYLGGNKRF